MRLLVSYVEIWPCVQSETREGAFNEAAFCESLPERNQEKTQERAVDEFVHQVGAVQHGAGRESRSGGWGTLRAFLSDALPGGRACRGAGIEGTCFAAVPILLLAA